MQLIHLLAGLGLLSEIPATMDAKTKVCERKMRWSEKLTPRECSNSLSSILCRVFHCVTSQQGSPSHKYARVQVELYHIWN